MRQLAKLPWPGNVRQLRKVLAETVARRVGLPARYLQVGLSEGLGHFGGSHSSVIRQPVGPPLKG